MKISLLLRVFELQVWGLTGFLILVEGFEVLQYLALAILLSSGSRFGF